MMKSIVEEKLVSFKTLEQKVFDYVCELGRQMTRIILERYDDELAEERDKEAFRDKGKRKPLLRQCMERSLIPAEFIRQKMRMGGQSISTFWIRQ